jgi:hypothetical protein
VFGPPFWTALALVLLLLAGWLLSTSAARLDRLHNRVESARASLDVQLARRAGAALELAPVLDPATAVVLSAAAAEALDHTGRADRFDDAAGDREDAESDLTRALHAAFDDPAVLRALRRDPVAADLLARLAQACTRVELARRFHNDAVAQAQRVRRKRVVRWARLAGRAPMPQMIELDDTAPPMLGPPGAPLGSPYDGLAAG